MDIRKFVQEQTYVLENKDKKSLRCIDDRYSNDNAPLANYAVPGGGLGILADVVSGFETVLFSNTNSGYSEEILTSQQIEAIYASAENYISTPSFHTGKSHAKIDSPVKGCGYLAETLEGNATLSKKSAYFLKSKANQLLANNYTPVSFHEDHSASFILLIEGDDIGIIPTAPDGTRAYIVHKDVRVDLLTKISSTAYDQLKHDIVFDSVAVPKEEFVNAVLNAAATRLDTVVKKVLKLDNLPQFIVFKRDGEIDVRSITEPISVPMQASHAA